MVVLLLQVDVYGADFFYFFICFDKIVFELFEVFDLIVEVFVLFIEIVVLVLQVDV